MKWYRLVYRTTESPGEHHDRADQPPRRASSPAARTRPSQQPPRGRPPEYCADQGHNAVAAWRERKRQADAERGVTTSEADTEQPVTMARVTGAEMLRQMRELAAQLAGVTERLTGAVATIGDPTAAEAEVEAARAAAEQRAATAEAERAEAERRAATADQMRARRRTRQPSR